MARSRREPCGRSAVSSASRRPDHRELAAHRTCFVLLRSASGPRRDRATRPSAAPNSRDGRIRTDDPRVPNAVLYQAELHPVARLNGRACGRRAHGRHASSRSGRRASTVRPRRPDALTDERRSTRSASCECLSAAFSPSPHWPASSLALPAVAGAAGAHVRLVGRRLPRRAPRPQQGQPRPRARGDALPAQRRAHEPRPAAAALQRAAAQGRHGATAAPWCASASSITSAPRAARCSDPHPQGHELPEPHVRDWALGENLGWGSGPRSTPQAMVAPVDGLRRSSRQHPQRALPPRRHRRRHRRAGEHRRRTGRDVHDRLRLPRQE